MPKKSIRFIARDIGRSFDYIKRAIDELGIEPDDYSDEGTPTYNEESQRKIQTWANIGITWYCDKCGKIMNNQPGFNTHSGIWTCAECGYENDVTENNIRI